MRVVGVDVSRGHVCACALEQIPRSLKVTKADVLTLQADRPGLETLIEMGGDLYVLEPTGTHYSRLWAERLEQAGLKVGWVSNGALQAYRKDQKVGNKSDAIDAVGLAAYGLERHDRPQHWIQHQPSTLKDLYYSQQHLKRLTNPLINRLRQQLAHEWPEMAQKDLINAPGTASGLVHFIAGEPHSRKKWAETYRETIGLGLSDFSKRLARHLIAIQADRAEISAQILTELAQPLYAPYVRACERVGMLPGNTMALIVGTAYPFERFLGPDGLPRDEHRQGGNGKRQRVRRSLQSFKMACGMGMVQIQSGQKEQWVKGGSAEIRSALWTWITATLIFKKAMPLENEVLEALRQYYCSGLAGVRNQRQSRLIRRWLEALYRELCAELCSRPPKNP